MIERRRRWPMILIVAGCLASATASPAPGQDTAPEKSAADRFQTLTDPDGLEKTLEKAKEAREKIRPPFEFFKTEVAPYDILPFVKPGHWITLSLEARSNFGPFEGLLSTPPVKLPGMPHVVDFRRPALLPQDQTSRLGLQLLLPESITGLNLELTHADAIRPDGVALATILRLETHQMLIPILGTDPGAFSGWSKYHAMIPTSGDKDAAQIDKQRYYKLVIPQNPEKSVLSTHPLTWSTISHVVWDDLPADVLSDAQERALIDWLHFGGQLIVSAGVGTSMSALQERGLGPYLPAEATGKTVTLGPEALDALSNDYRPPLWDREWDDFVSDLNPMGTIQPLAPPPYKPPAPIKTVATRPVVLNTLVPTPGSTPIVIRGVDAPPLAVERRVGRGRVTMIAFRPNDPSLTAWQGYDDLVRRVVLRRPDETWPADLGAKEKAYPLLSAQDLSTFRLLGRDLGTKAPEAKKEASIDVRMPPEHVAVWDDDASELPETSRKALEKASGISVPPARFVLRVMVAYLVALVPLNWLVSHYLVRRKEVAWAIVPFLAIGFAVGVERLAARDLGYESACDEIDVVEVQGGYTRAHVSRFAALYSTGRSNYTISFPNDPTALALPLNMKRALSVEDVRRSTFQSLPEPALVDFPVEPRSLSMYRTEQLMPIGGPIDLVEDAAGRRLVNASGLELRDAVLVDARSGRETPIGTIAPGETVDVSKGEGRPGAALPKWIDTKPFLDRLRSYRWNRPEDAGEVRLVAWGADAIPGEVIRPAVDRHRGLRLVVVHLSYGGTPDPARPPFKTPTTRDQEKALNTYFKAKS